MSFPTHEAHSWPVTPGDGLCRSILLSNLCSFVERSGRAVGSERWWERPQGCGAQQVGPPSGRRELGGSIFLSRLVHGVSVKASWCTSGNESKDKCLCGWRSLLSSRASGTTEQEDLWRLLVPVVSFWLPLWSSCSACRSLLSPPGAPASFPMPYKEWRGQILSLVCHLGPGHQESRLCVSYGYLRHLGDLALCLPPSRSCVSFTGTESTRLQFLLLLGV